ncbi:MAG: hypothetical protein UZ12_BCD005002552 [Bacteroidetes bacterium OLB12]|nr:MAG: hypothetical protein UZ12_BCD005002552 [Bacteroidetes bacterium OLB12]
MLATNFLRPMEHAPDKGCAKARNHLLLLLLFLFLTTAIVFNLFVNFPKISTVQK